MAKGNWLAWPCLGHSSSVSPLPVCSQHLFRPSRTACRSGLSQRQLQVVYLHLLGAALICISSLPVEPSTNGCCYHQNGACARLTTCSIGGHSCSVLKLLPLSAKGPKASEAPAPKSSEGSNAVELQVRTYPLILCTLPSYLCTRRIANLVCAVRTYSTGMVAGAHASALATLGVG